MCKLLHSFFVYILHSIQTYLQFVLYVCYMQLHWPKSKLDRVLSLGEPWVFNLQRRSKCRRGKEEKKGAQKESSKYKREGGEGSKKNEKGNDVSHKGWWDGRLSVCAATAGRGKSRQRGVNVGLSHVSVVNSVLFLHKINASLITFGDVWQTGPDLIPAVPAIFVPEQSRLTRCFLCPHVSLCFQLVPVQFFSPVVSQKICCLRKLWEVYGEFMPKKGHECPSSGMALTYYRFKESAERPHWTVTQYFTTQIRIHRRGKGTQSRCLRTFFIITPKTKSWRSSGFCDLFPDGVACLIHLLIDPGLELGLGVAYDPMRLGLCLLLVSELLNVLAMHRSTAPVHDGSCLGY